jgi:8-oxo-dGTP pyrophosphatase MutT (NUDIX family)
MTVLKGAKKMGPHDRLHSAAVKVSEEETRMRCALREYQERTGDTIPGKLPYLPTFIGMVKQYGDKTKPKFDGIEHLYVYAYECDWKIELDKLSSVKCWSQPDNRGKWDEEVDGYKWFTFSELEAVTHPAHLELYIKIRELYEDKESILRDRHPKEWQVTVWRYHTYNYI